MVKIYWVYDYNLAQQYDKDKAKLVRLLENRKVDYIQLRCKDVDARSEWVKKLMPKLTVFTIPIIINDDVLLAREVNADGVHLGRQDMDPKEAREVLGDDKIIGVTARSLEEVQKLQKEPINYLGIGTVFKSKTKANLEASGVEFIKEVAPVCELEFFPIGGINSSNVKELAKVGLQSVAIASCLFEAKDCLEEVSMIRNVLENGRR